MNFDAHKNEKDVISIRLAQMERCAWTRTNLNLDFVVLKAVTLLLRREEYISMNDNNLDSVLVLKLLCVSHARRSSL